MLAFVPLGPENVDCPEFPSPWWQNVADVLSKSSHMEQASAAALVCRSVIAEVEREKILQVRVPLVYEHLFPFIDDDIKNILPVAFKRGNIRKGE